MMVALFHALLSLMFGDVCSPLQLFDLIVRENFVGGVGDGTQLVCRISGLPFIKTDGCVVKMSTKDPIQQHSHQLAFSHAVHKFLS